MNSAGITRDRTMMKLTEEDFDKVVNVNLKVYVMLTGKNREVY